MFRNIIFVLMYHRHNLLIDEDCLLVETCSFYLYRNGDTMPEL
jgi:hypothetical protein